MLKTMVLCAGRHDVPANDGAIFPGEINPLDVTGMEQEATLTLARAFKVRQFYRCDNCGGGFVLVDTPAYYCPICDGNHVHGWADEYEPAGHNLRLYVTGLSVALVAVLNACRGLGITVELLHYDRESGSYYSQEVV